MECSSQRRKPSCNAEGSVWARAREHLPLTTQSVRHARTSSCHTTGIAWARQRNAGPKQGHLFNSLGQPYPRALGPYTLECLCYMEGCLLQTGASSCQMQTIMWPDTGECLCQWVEFSSRAKRSSYHTTGSAYARPENAWHRHCQHSRRHKHPFPTQSGDAYARQWNACPRQGGLSDHKQGDQRWGMLVLYEGMPSTIKGILRWNADNHNAMQRRMLVSCNGVLISNKEVFLQHKRDYLCKAKECFTHTKQPFLQTQASSCQAIRYACARLGHPLPTHSANAYARQWNAYPRQGGSC